MITDTIKSRIHEFTKSEVRIAECIINEPYHVIDISISEFASLTKTSDATIIRFCHRLGLSGFYQLKIKLANELGNQGMIVGESAENTDLVSLFWSKIQNYILTLSANINQGTVLECVNYIMTANIIHIGGWGNTGTISADFAHRLTRFGLRTFTSDIPEYSMRSLAACTPDSLYIAISHSGLSIHIVDSLKLAKSLNIKTILISNAPNSPASRYADLKLFADVKNEIFHDLGAASHLVEMMIIDLLIFFVESKIEPSNISDQAEVLLSRYKL